ncbi:MAG: hypothetical protein LC769_09935 [Chloroflexi bacterium]|nr:hypothetical protein [Chloroflexota bacterium]
MNEGEKKSSRMRFIQARLPNDLYEWLRTRGFLMRRSMNSIVLEAIADYRVAVDAKEIVLSKDGSARDETIKYNVRVDDDLYEWLRSNAFYARLSINAIFVSALVRYRDVHPDTSPTPEGAGQQGA